MSSFCGIFPSLPGVSCDNFGGANLLNDQFFLSHCHADHMSGLDRLCQLLVRKNQVRVNHRIYCSMISKAFLVRKYPTLAERFVKDLFTNEPVELNVFDKAQDSFYKLRVTAIPAHHCPGSVMFLFETLSSVDGEDAIGRRILYTGDFRFDNIPLTSLSALHLDKGSAEPLPLDEAYLDTTFCHPQYKSFPTRDQALASIWPLVHGWVRKNGMYRNQRDKHVVLFHLPAQYGSEAILRDIYERSGAKWRIHVSERKFRDYLCSDDLGDCTDSDPKLAQWIHACSWKEERGSKSRQYFLREIPCQSGQFEVCQIRPSAMYFRQDRMNELEDKVVKCVGGQFYRVCYSCHSSLDELLKFVQYFRPKKVVPCVLPQGMTMAEVITMLSSAMNRNPADVNEAPSTQDLGSLGMFTPEKKSSEEDSQMMRLQTWKSPSPMSGGGGRKRPAVPYVKSLDGDALGSSSKRSLFCDSDADVADNGDNGHFHNSWDLNAVGTGRSCDGESTDDEDEDNVPGPSAAASSSSSSPSATSATSATEQARVTQARRRFFMRSRSCKTNYSMPLVSATPTGKQSNNSRRASLPPNLKIIPTIKIIPASPNSPDPNHPDYPEFYEDRLYLESRVNVMSSSSSSSSSSDKPSAVTSEAEAEAEAGNMEVDTADKGKGKEEEEADSLNLVLSQEQQEKHDSSLEICYESVNPSAAAQSLPGGPTPAIIDLCDSSDDLFASASETENNSDSQAYEDMESTPEIETLLENAQSEVEKENCNNFLKGQQRERKRTGE